MRTTVFLWLLQTQVRKNHQISPLNSNPAHSKSVFVPAQLQHSHNYSVCVCRCVCVACFPAWKALFQLKVFDPAARRDRPARSLVGGRQRCVFAPLLGVSTGSWCVIQCQACGPTQDISPIIAACSPRPGPCWRCERASSQTIMDSGCHLLFDINSTQILSFSCGFWETVRD